MVPTDETVSQRFARELLEILSELRIAIPGVQLLFGFMLVAPLSDRFDRLGHAQREIFLVGFLATTVASALLIAPAVYHRLHWRREIADKERMLATFTTMVIVGAFFLAVAMTCVIFVVTDFLFARRWSIVATVAGALMFVGLWFALPLSRRVGAPKKQPIAPSR